MPANLLSGKVIADAIKAEVAAEIAELKAVHGISPGLAVVRVGDDPASTVYVGSKVRTSADLGIVSEHQHLDADTSEARVLAAVESLNRRNDIDGILVQLPLPRNVDERRVLEMIDPEKDVDGFHPINFGRLAQGYPALAPCTPAGVIEILKRSGIEIAGKHAVIVGRSNIVGKPMAMLLLKENATVTICHSRTIGLAGITRQADILIAAIGRAGFIGGEHIGEGSTVIDVGINNVSDAEFAATLFSDDELEKRLGTVAKRGFTLVGDVNPKEAIARAANFTPVPGGVGLLTVAMLMKNTIEAAKARRIDRQIPNRPLTIMKFEEYQSEASITALYPNRLSNLEYPTLGLAGEAGEVANIVKKIQRDHGGVVNEEIRGKLKDELGDVLWYISACADELGLTLNEIAEFNVAKLAKRHNRVA